MRFVTVLVVAMFTAGCSIFIAHAGKDVEGKLDEGASSDTVEKLVGKPTYDQVVPPNSGATTRKSSKETVPFSRYAEYQFTGRADDLVEFIDLGMMTGLTLGVGEVVAFPLSINRSARLEDVVHYYYVWYDADGRCVSYKSNHGGQLGNNPGRQ